jgi:uncharacterized protein YacL
MDIWTILKESGIIDKILAIILPFLVSLILRLISTIITFGFTMSIVYLSGRMFEIAKTNISRNTIAFIVILICSYLTSSSLTLNISKEIIVNTLFTIMLSILAYVLIGFNLFSRVDNLLDKIAEDSPKVDEEVVKTKKRRVSKKSTVKGVKTGKKGGIVRWILVITAAASMMAMLKMMF